MSSASNVSTRRPFPSSALVAIATVRCAFLLRLVFSQTTKAVQVHAGAYEAYLEARNATNNWQDVRDHLGQHIWSSAGAGFGGMVQQIAALETSGALIVSSSSYR